MREFVHDAKTRVANCSWKDECRFFDSKVKYNDIAQSVITQTEKTLGMGDDEEPNQDMRLVTCEHELPSLMECAKKAMQHCQESLGGVDQERQHTSNEVQTYFQQMKPDDSS